MMRKFMIVSLMAFSFALPANAATTRCRDAHGHFTACPPAGAAPAARPAVATHPAPAARPAAAAHPAAATGGITRDRNGRCHGAGGRFVRCPTTAAH